MDTIVALSRRLAPALLRASLAVVLVWIGGLKFVDPAPVVGLLEASFAFLAAPGFVHLLGAVEVAAGLCLFAGVGLAWVGVVAAGLFAGTLTILVIAPAVAFGEAGFPALTLAGEFLLKDLVLLAASIAIVGTSTVARQAEPMPARGTARAA